MSAADCLLIACAASWVLGVQAGRWSVYVQAGLGGLWRRLADGYRLAWDELMPAGQEETADPWA